MSYTHHMKAVTAFGISNPNMRTGCLVRLRAVLLGVCGLAAAALPGAAQVQTAPQVFARDEAGKTTLRAVRLTVPIRLDGTLDEEVYRQVPPIDQFLQAEGQSRFVAVLDPTHPLLDDVEDGERVGRAGVVVRLDGVAALLAACGKDPGRGDRNRPPNRYLVAGLG